MKSTERAEAIKLRKEGESIKEIARILQVSKSSVSLWVRNINLSSSHTLRLYERGRSAESVQRRRISRIFNEKERRASIFRSASKDIGSLSLREVMFLGIGLYWGEGAKSSRGSACFYNSDPRAVQVMMRFYREVCDVPLSKFKARVHIHGHLDTQAAIDYWSRVSGIPTSQFGKPATQKSRGSKGKKDTLPYGTFTIGVYDTKLYLKIMGWIDGSYQSLVSKKAQVPCRYHEYL